MDQKTNQQISLANFYFQNHRFEEAIKIYDILIEQDDKNYVLFCNRSACMFKLERNEESLKDAEKAIHLNPNSIKAYFRKGMALNSLKLNIDSMMAFAKGLTIDKENNQLLNCMLSTLESSKFWPSIEPSLNQLKLIQAKLDPFLLISLVAQHILTLDYFLESSILLNCCLKIGTDSLKLRSSIFASLAVAYWKLASCSEHNKLDNTNYNLASIDAMKNDLDCMIKLNDLDGQYRALSNLASAYYQLKQFDEALNNYKAQLDLTKILNDKIKIIDTLKQIAIVYQQLKEFKNAISIYEELLVMANQEGNLNLILKCSKALSSLFAQSNDHQLISKSIQYQEQVCKLVEKVLNFQKLQPKAYLDLCDLYERVGNHQKSIEISQKIILNSNLNDDKNLELLVYERLANNEIKLLNFLAAKGWIEKQLNLIEIMDPIKEKQGIKLNCLINLANINFKLKNYKLSIDLKSESGRIHDFRTCIMTVMINFMLGYIT